jgi:Mor family transcriptional regulator
MSELMIRTLAEACAPKIAPKVEAAVQTVVREHLPGVLMDVLRDMAGSGAIKLYAPKISRAERKSRADAIRQRYDGHNAMSLAKEFKLHPQHIRRIAKGRV